MSTNANVVIVGAGAAGVAAARRLAQSGLPAMVLEATARIGGRAWTCEVAGLHLDLGCGWLHSADRNPWTRVADAAGFAIDRRTPAWGRPYRDLGFSQAEQAAATQAFTDWRRRMRETPPASDCAADALEPDGEWNDYLQAMSGFLTGAGLERISVADYIAYDAASTACTGGRQPGTARSSQPACLVLSTCASQPRLSQLSWTHGLWFWRRRLAPFAQVLRSSRSRRLCWPEARSSFRGRSTLGGTPSRR
jgi:choline dehydrogenase-like flavoprotein